VKNEKHPAMARGAKESPAINPGRAGDRAHVTEHRYDQKKSKVDAIARRGQALKCP
jgi:hypothetical protein